MKKPNTAKAVPSKARACVPARGATAADDADDGKGDEEDGDTEDTECEHEGRDAAEERRRRRRRRLDKGEA